MPPSQTSARSSRLCADRNRGRDVAEGPLRTAVIGRATGMLYMVNGARRLPTAIGSTTISADAVELNDLMTGAYRRLALRE